MFTIFFLGISCFQLVFITYQYLLLRRIEFVYYFLYALFISVYIIGNLLPQFNPLSFSNTEENVFTIGRGIIFISYAMYFHFGRQFTDLPVKDKPFNRFIVYLSNTILTIGIADIILQLTGVSYLESDKIIRWIFFCVFFVSIYVVVYLIRKRQALTTILVIGSLLLILGASIGLLDLLFFSKHSSTPSRFIIYLEAGIICEFLFLTYGLVYKTKMLNEENVTLIESQYRQIIEERKRIIADLHDDVGATLSSMHIYGELAGEVWESKPQQSREMVNRITTQAKELMNRMGDIVWSLKPSGEDKNTLSARLKNYSNELLAARSIECEFSIDEEAGYQIGNPAARKNILLIAKEAMNNIAKYSRATRATLTLRQEGKEIILEINDNGVGFDQTITHTGNGLQNMKERCTALNGRCRTRSAIGQGTQISCSFPLANISHTGQTI